MQRYDWEWAILEWLNRISNEFLTYLFYIITQLGGEIVLIGIVALIYFCIDKKKGEKIGFIALTSMAFNNTLKSLIQAQRPFEYSGRNHLLKFNEGTVSATGSSFPSGHSQNTASLYSAIALYFKKKWIWVIAIVLMVLVPLSRMYLGVHFPSDVIVGTLLGLGTSIVLYFLIRFWERKKYDVHTLYILVLIIFIPFLFINAGDDFYKGYGLLFGFVVGTWIEHQYVKFSNDVPLLFKIIRLVLALGIIFLVKEGVKGFLNLISPDLAKEHWANTLRYFLISFLGIGILPFLFKRIERGL